jgi:hypothetical protein
MTSIILDPGLLAFIPTLSKLDLMQRIDLLSDWSKTSGTQPWVKIALVPGLHSFLERNNLFPSYEPAKALLQSTGLNVIYSPEDIIRPLYNLLEGAFKDEFCCVNDELHDGFRADPKQPWHGEATVDGMSQRALILSHVENVAHRRRKLCIFASILRSPKVIFSARLDALEPPSSTGAYTLPDMPREVEDEFAHVRSFEDVCSLIEAHQVWATATTTFQIKLAIQLGCRKHLINAASYVDFSHIPNFHVGKDFLPSLIRWQANGKKPFAAQALQSCVAAVLDLPAITIKVFHKAKRAKDSAEPLRAHISERGVGLRLMMWQRPGPKRCIELANVGGKAEEEISYSDPKDAE